MRFTSNQVSLLRNQSLLSMLVTSYQGKHRGNLLTSGHIHGLSLAKPHVTINKYMHITNGNHQSHICPPLSMSLRSLNHHTMILQSPHICLVFRRGQKQYHSFTGHSRILLHEQLKLAGAARGLPGDHGPPKAHFFLPVQFATT